MASKQRRVLKEINGNSSPLKPLRSKGKPLAPDRQYAHANTSIDTNHKQRCTHRHKRRRSSYDQPNPLVESFTAACEDYLESAAVKVETDVDEVYKQLLADLDQNEDECAESSIAGLRASLRSLSEPLEKDPQHGIVLTKALQDAKTVEETMRSELAILTEQHQVLTDRIKKTYNDLVESVSPVSVTKGKQQQEKNLVAEHEHHFADLEKQIREIDQFASNAIDGQIKKESQDRRKIETMLQRIWDV